MKKYHLLIGILLLLLFSCFMNIELFGNPFDKPFIKQENNNKSFIFETLCRKDDNCPKSVEIKIRDPSASADYIEPPYSSLDESFGEFIGENDGSVSYREIFMKLSELEEKIEIYGN